MARKNTKSAQEEAPALLPQQLLKVDFDAWWAMNEKKIPAHHHKEIIWADFKGRGLSTKESLNSYNEALNKYGLKLK